MTDLLERNIACTDTGRRLSIQESMFLEINQSVSNVGSYFHVNLLESLHPITDYLVKQSLYELAKLHFFLKANVAKDNDGNYFFREMTDLDENMKWIPLNCIYAESTSDWVTIVTNNLKKRIDFGPWTFVESSVGHL